MKKNNCVSKNEPSKVTVVCDLTSGKMEVEVNANCVIHGYFQENIKHKLEELFEELCATERLVEFLLNEREEK